MSVKNDNEKSILDALNKNYDNFIIILSGVLTLIFATTNKWILISPIISSFSILLSYIFYTILLYMDDSDYKSRINVVVVGIIGFINITNIIYVICFLIIYLSK